MNRPKYQKILIICLALTIIISLYFIFSNTAGADASSSIEDSIETRQIENVIVNSYEIEIAAANTFDTTAFASVFVNDSRGGELSRSTSTFVNSVSESNDSGANPGYLDYKLAYYNWWKEGALKIELLHSKAIREGRSLTKDELKTLVDKDGRLAMPRGQINDRSVVLQFISISIENDVATIVFDDGPRTNQMTLVKIKDEWLIAGNVIQAVHP